MTTASFVCGAEEITFLNLDDVIFIHEIALHTGGSAGNLKLSDLQSALGRPSSYHLYDDVCDLVFLAAVLWHGISESHGFVDGNKRTGLLSALAFLEANGIEVDESVPSWQPGMFTDASYKRKTFSVLSIANYLSTHCRWIDEE